MSARWSPRPLIVQLRGQQADLIRQEADLASKYGPLHPKLQAVEAQKRDLDAKIAQEVTRIAGSMGNDVATTQAHLNSLQQSLSQVERQANGQNQSRVELEALQSNADSTKAQYEAFVGRLRSDRRPGRCRRAGKPHHQRRHLAAFSQQPQALADCRRLHPAGFSAGPVDRADVRAFRTHAAGARASAPRATVINPPRRAGKMAPKPLPAVWSGPPILAELANAEKLGAAAYVVDYPGSRYAQAMAALVSQFDSNEAGAAVVAVTGRKMAKAKARWRCPSPAPPPRWARKTVLIDCDPGQLAMKAMEAPAKAGLYEVLTGTVPLSEALAKDSRTGAYALAMTRRPPRLATMFTSAAMARLIQVLKEGADLVILDCSRAGPEAGMLARLSDATLLVTRKDALGKLALSKSVALLAGAQAAPLAIIATK